MTTSFEDRVRDDLHAAVGGASFGHLDPTFVIGLGQRAVRRRRLSYAAATAAVSLVAVAIGVGVGSSGPGRSVAPPAGTTSSSSSSSPTPSTSTSTSTSTSGDGNAVNAGPFGSRAELRPAGSETSYAVRGVVSEGHRFASLEDLGGAVVRPVAGLRLDRPQLADVTFTEGAFAVMVTPGPVESVRMGNAGPALEHVASAPVPGATQWLTVASMPESWQQPWGDLSWTTTTGVAGEARAPRSATATIPAEGGAAGWSAMPIRFTARPVPDAAALVEVEKAGAPSLGLNHLGTITLSATQDQEFARGDGGAFATLYGLTRAKPVSVTPRGDTSSRFVDGWTFATVEVAEGVWATAIQLSGMDDSSPDPVPSVSWKDGTGATHTFDLR